MSVSEWKKVNLYVVTQCPQYKKSASKGKLTSVCYNGKQRILCDDAGYVYVYGRNWECISFRAVQTAITLSALTPDTNRLFIVTKNNDKNEWLLKVYNLIEINKRAGAPCVGSARICSANPLVSLAACMRGSSVYLAIGTQKGDIFLHRGPLSSDMSGNFQSFQTTPWAIKGVAFQYLQQQMYLFTCSYGGICVYTLNESTNQSLVESKFMLDSDVAEVHCSALLHDGQETYFMVARDDALFYFTKDCRGPCYALDGVKKQIGAFGQNIVVILEQGGDDNIIIIDTRNKMITLNKKLNKILDVIIERDECFIITQDGDVHVIREWDLENKLRLLCEKNLYNVALQLTESIEKSDEQLAKSIATIYLKYGDNLLMKGDVSEAIEKYKRTLGYVEPYCIIKKLMDSRNTKFLAQYLNALVNSEYAEVEHLELLQNCNERLQLPIRLKQTYENLNYYNDEIIATNGWDKFENTLSLNQFLKSTQDLNIAASLFEKSSEVEIHAFFLEHGQLLMEKHAAITTEVLKKIYASENNQLKQPERLLSVLIYNEHYCSDFVQFIIETRPDCDKSLVDMMLNLKLRIWHAKPTVENSTDLMKLLKEHRQRFNSQHAFILCRLYRFWPGVKYLYKFSLQKEYVCKADEEEEYTATLLKTLVKKESSKSSQTKSNLFSNHLNEILEEKEQSTLQILKNLCKNKEIKMSDVKEYFGQQHFKRDSYDLQEQKQLVDNLLQMTQNLQELVDQYETCPIEFRSSICDSCKQEIKQPTKYFLCQHAYHIECLSAYEEGDICVVCAGNRKTSFLPDNLQLNMEKGASEDHSIYTNLLFHGIFNKAKTELEIVKPAQKTIQIKPAVTIPDDSKQWSGRFTHSKEEVKSKNPFEEKPVIKSTNPFEEYDSNLNPFDE